MMAKISGVDSGGNDAGKENVAVNADNDRESIEDYKQALIHPAAMLYGVQKMLGDRAKAKQAYGQLIDAHLLVAGVLGAGLLRTNGAVTPSTATSEERNALFAAFNGAYAIDRLRTHANVKISKHIATPPCYCGLWDSAAISLSLLDQPDRCTKSANPVPI